MKILGLFRNLGKRRTPGFTSRIYLTLICSIIIISCSFTAFFIHHLKKSRTEILINKGELLAAQLAENARIGVFAENNELLEDPSNSVMRQKEVLAVEIFTLKGKLLIDQCKTSVTIRHKSKNKDSREEQKIMSQLIGSVTPVHILTEGAMDFWAPVQYATRFTPSETLFLTDNPRQSTVQTIGFARVILDKKQLEKSFQTLLYNSILITAVILIIVVFVAYFVTKGITKPLSRLHDGVLALGTGASVEKIPVESNDEVGKLAAAFNEMSESLKMREMEKEQLTEQLLQAQKMEAVGTLAGGIAHDFNNILTAIIGYSHLLLMKSAENDPSRNYINQILNSSNRAAELTHGLLAFSRKQVMIPRAVELNEVVGHLQKMLRRLIRENIELKVETAGEELIVMADRGKIEQVLMNLVTNARDAMPHGGKIAITTSRKTMNGEFLCSHGYGEPGEYACITVSDMGSGMDEETRKKIFEPFFTTKEVGKGTGLGLSIVYGIVKQHNGYINVYSEPGEGTTFRIYLPLVKAKREIPVIKDETYPRGGAETLLLAEDDPAVNKLHRMLLEEVGYTVITADNGADALRKFGQNEGAIKLLILDVIMPRMSGKNVLDVIRERKPDMKALFISGYSADVVNHAEIVQRNACFMTKPIDPVEFLKKVREVLDQQM